MINYSFIKTVLKVMTIILAIATGLIVLLLAALLFLSPGKPIGFTDNSGNPLEGSISEKTFMNIGGVQQGMIIRSKNTQNPVLLYIHGGPGFPNYFLIEKFNPGLEDYFTVCYWEQRGGGLSFTPEVSVESMTLEQLTADAIEVTNYLRKRFEKEKIFMLAHSGGTTIALKAAANAPSLFYAYIAMAQITNQTQSERIAYQFILEEYKTRGNLKAIDKLQQFNGLVDDSSVLNFYQSGLRDQAMHDLGIGTMHKMKSVFWEIFLPVWTCRAYTLNEKFKIWKSKFTFLPKTNLNTQLLSTDFGSEFPLLEIPVYFFSGKYDLTVNVDLSHKYFEKLNAPIKAFYTFENSAHSPLFEEPLRFRKILESDILPLALHDAGS